MKNQAPSISQLRVCASKPLGVSLVLDEEIHLLERKDAELTGRRRERTALLAREASRERHHCECAQQGGGWLSARRSLVLALTSEANLVGC